MTESLKFDQVLPLLRSLMLERHADLVKLAPLYLVRDLWGKVRVLLDSEPLKGPDKAKMTSFVTAIHNQLGARSYPVEHAVLYTKELGIDIRLEHHTPLDVEGLDVRLIERQITGLSWTNVAPAEPEAHPPRFTFYSLKGGVGRSTAIAVTAWKLAKQGERVLVIDLDLEAPGLTASLLPAEAQPTYGCVDWLVEALLGQQDAVIREMTANSPLAQDSDGEIRVAPCHGRDAGEYIAKLGRSTMGVRTPGAIKNAQPRASVPAWEERVQQLVRDLELHCRPTVVLIDSRAGLHDMASAAVTDLDAHVLVFGLGTRQTWDGYRLLFEHWRRSGTSRSIRERVSLVAAQVPELGRAEYLHLFLEQAYDLIADTLYDAADATQSGDDEPFNFDLHDDQAPHRPLPIYWHRGFAALSGFTDLLDAQQVEAAFGAYLAGFDTLIKRARNER
jgi:CO dehydrogenase nickel-insertion accessory protein CooC1